VCPSLGYYEFLELDFLTDVLSWQLPNGCYGKMSRPNVKLEQNDKWNKLMGTFKDDYVDDDNDDDNIDNKETVHEMSVNDDKKLDFERKWKQKFNIVEQNGVRKKGRKLLVERVMSGKIF